MATHLQSNGAGLWLYSDGKKLAVINAFGNNRGAFIFDDYIVAQYSATISVPPPLEMRSVYGIERVHHGGLPSVRLDIGIESSGVVTMHVDGTDKYFRELYATLSSASVRQLFREIERKLKERK